MTFGGALRHAMNPVPKAAFEFRDDPAALMRAAMPQPVDEQSFALQGLWLKFVDPRSRKPSPGKPLCGPLSSFAPIYWRALGLCAFGFLDTLVGGSAAHIVMASLRRRLPDPVSHIRADLLPLFQRVGQLALSAAMLTSGLGVVAMTAIMPAPYNSQYHPASSWW